MEKSRQKAWEAYKSNNPEWSEYMQADYEHGYEDGWRGHERQSKRHLYDIAYTAALNALIQERNCPPSETAKLAVEYARELIRQVYGDNV